MCLFKVEKKNPLEVFVHKCRVFKQNNYMIASEPLKMDQWKSNGRVAVSGIKRPTNHLWNCNATSREKS